MNKEQINNRFLEAVMIILRQKIEKNKSALANSLGLKSSKFSEILNERMMAGTDLLSLICQKYNINPTWLLLGVNGMFMDKTETSKVNDDKSILDRYSDLLIEYGKIVKENELLKKQIDEMLKYKGGNVGIVNSTIAHVG